MKTPVIVIHDCEVYFYKSAELNEWKKYSIHVYDGQGTSYWVNSKEPFIIFHYGTDIQIDPLSIAASSGGDSAMRQCANPLAISARLRRQSGWESFCSQPFFELSVARLPRSSR